MIRGAIYRDGGVETGYVVHLTLDGVELEVMGPFDDELDAMLAARRHADEVYDLPAGTAPYRLGDRGAE